jgi:hypothetical protein
VTFLDPIAWEETLPIRRSSPAWRATIKALYGSPLGPNELDLFRSLAGRELPEGGAVEFLVVAGRRAGKSETIARVATFEAVHGGHGLALAPGQRALIPIISPLREQSQEILGYCRGLAELAEVSPDVLSVTTSGVEFRTGVSIRVMTADAVNVSGPTVVCAIRDELAKFPGDDSAMPDREIDNSLRPALAPLIGAPPRRFIGITSAYIKEGVAFETDRDHFGCDSDVLVVRGSTEQFNPNIDRAWLARELRRVGPRVFAREYLAEWQDAITESWFGTDTIERCIERGVEFRDPVKGQGYVIAIDQAFSGDRFALAIAHREPSGKSMKTVLDRVQFWRPPIELLRVIGRTVEIAREYGSMAMLADQYSYRPLRELYIQKGIQLRELAWTSSNKAPIFRAVLNEMQAGRVSIPDDPELIKEFHAIQGRALRSGGEQIEARSGHDDLVHAAVMAMAETMRATPDYGEYQPPRPTFASVPNHGRSAGDGLVKRESAQRGHDYSLSAAERQRRFLDDDK